MAEECRYEFAADTEIADQIADILSGFVDLCCFPQCQVSESQFLVGAHIARWVDVPSLRGRTDNGLCLCLIHDKAFEIGMYTLDASGTVVINPKYQTSAPNSLFQTSIYPFNGHEAELGSIRPSGTALRHHWERIQVSPSG